MLPSGFRKSVSAEAVAHMTWGPLSHSLSLSLSLAFFRNPGFRSAGCGFRGLAVFCFFSRAVQRRLKRRRGANWLATSRQDS